MPEFNYRCLILDTLPRTIEISVHGQVRTEDADADGNATLQARGLFGPVEVSYRNIPDDGAGFIPVNTYTTFARINMGVRVYERHLSDSIDKYRQDCFDRTAGNKPAVDLINAYNRLKNDVLPVAWALHNIRIGLNDLGDSVWLRDVGVGEVMLKGVPGMSRAPGMPTPAVVSQRPSIARPTTPRVSISRLEMMNYARSELTAPIATTPRPVTPTPSETSHEYSDWVPTPSPPPTPRTVVPSAPPHEHLYPELPSHAIYPPPSYSAVMSERSTISRSKLCNIL